MRYYADVAAADEENIVAGLHLTLTGERKLVGKISGRNYNVRQAVPAAQASPVRLGVDPGDLTTVSGDNLSAWLATLMASKVTNEVRQAHADGSGAAREMELVTSAYQGSEKNAAYPLITTDADQTADKIAAESARAFQAELRRYYARLRNNYGHDIDRRNNVSYDVMTDEEMLEKVAARFGLDSEELTLSARLARASKEITTNATTATAAALKRLKDVARLWGLRLDYYQRLKAISLPPGGLQNDPQYHTAGQLVGTFQQMKKLENQLGEPATKKDELVTSAQTQTRAYDRANEKPSKILATRPTTSVRTPLMPN